MIMVPESLLKGLREFRDTWMKYEKTKLYLSFSCTNNEVHMDPVAWGDGIVAEFAGDHLFLELMDLTECQWKTWEEGSACIRFNFLSGEVLLDFGNCLVDGEGEDAYCYSNKEHCFRLDVNGPGELQMTYKEEE